MCLQLIPWLIASIFMKCWNSSGNCYYYCSLTVHSGVYWSSGQFVQTACRLPGYKLVNITWNIRMYWNLASIWPFHNDMSKWYWKNKQQNKQKTNKTKNNTIKHKKQTKVYFFKCIMMSSFLSFFFSNWLTN